MGVEGAPTAFSELVLFELGPSPPGFGEALAARLSRRLRLPCHVGAAPADLPLPELAGRNQIDADRLLQLVEALPVPEGCVRVAVTTRDIGHLIFTHFFGRARRGGGAVLVSTARLDPVFYGLPPDPGLVLERAAREIIHELGHAGGVGHCRSWECVMHFAATIADLELRGDVYCPRCAASLSHSGA